MNMDDQKIIKSITMTGCMWHMQSGRIIMKHVYLVWKKMGLIGKLYVTNLALTGLSTTAFIFCKIYLRYIL